MGLIPAAVERLAAEFGRLPGIGPKTAQRLTFHCMRATPESTAGLAAALADLHQRVRPCSRCYFIAEGDLCAVCSNPSRDQTVMCVVEEPLDVLAVGPDQLTIDALERRLDGGEVREVVIATDPDVEGEATAHYLGDRLASRGISVSRLAHGLPAGADLQYADELTVARAFAGRRSL
jgi:recombination protein RecR